MEPELFFTDEATSPIMNAKKHLVLLALAAAGALPLISALAADNYTNNTSTGGNTPSTSSASANMGGDANTAATTTPHADGKVTRAELDQKITTATNCITSLQSRADTSIPSWIVGQAKGVVILHRWSGGVVIGGTYGWGVGMKKTDGAFNNPVFYKVAGASLGAQVGGSETETIVFLMSDKALQSLADDKFVWSGNLRAIAGSHSSSASSLDNNVDVVLYQKSSGLDVGATIAATKLIPDDESNRLFYNKSTILPVEILSGKATAPDSAKSLTEALKKQPTSVVSNS